MFRVQNYETNGIFAKKSPLNGGKIPKNDEW